jgi:hypothetical protein
MAEPRRIGNDEPVGATGVTYRLSLFALTQVGMPGAAEAKGPRGSAGYDGNWNVLIITQSGSCDQAYSFPIQIAGNRVLSNGTTNVTGSVGRGGGVAVRVSSGGSFAAGTGHLGSSSGAGRWSGRGSAGVCSGRWQATRSGASSFNCRPGLVRNCTRGPHPKPAKVIVAQSDCRTCQNEKPRSMGPGVRRDDGFELARISAEPGPSPPGGLRTSRPARPWRRRQHRS